MQGKYLVTTDNWFFGPDGMQYRGAWGDVEVIKDTFLGVQTNRNSSNWFLKVGSDEKHILIAGCQIHYAIRSEERPTERAVDWGVNDGKAWDVVVPNRIWMAQ